MSKVLIPGNVLCFLQIYTMSSVLYVQLKDLSSLGIEPTFQRDKEIKDMYIVGFLAIPPKRSYKFILAESPTFDSIHHIPV